MVERAVVNFQTGIRRWTSKGENIRSEERVLGSG